MWFTILKITPDKRAAGFLAGIIADTEYATRRGNIIRLKPDWLPVDLGELGGVGNLVFDDLIQVPEIQELLREFHTPNFDGADIDIPLLTHQISQIEGDMKEKMQIELKVEEIRISMAWPGALSLCADYIYSGWVKFDREVIDFKTGNKTTEIRIDSEATNVCLNIPDGDFPRADFIATAVLAAGELNTWNKFWEGHE